MEIWKDILGYEGKYKISNYGRVLNVKTQKHLKPFFHTGGYTQVGLVDNKGKVKKYFIHRLVAIAFIPNPHNKPQVNHINEIKNYNHINNLEWVTHKENMNHGTSIKRASEKNKKPVIQYDFDDNFIKIWESQSEASKELNIRQGDISNVCTGRQNHCYGYKWKYYHDTVGD